MRRVVGGGQCVRELISIGFHAFEATWIGCVGRGEEEHAGGEEIVGGA